MSAVPAPSRERLTQLFLELAGHASPSLHERPVADAITAHLRAIGVTVHEDHTGVEIGGDAGNVWCTVEGDGTAPHVALGAHMDTVEPTDRIEPVLDEAGVFRNRRQTILGADDKAAIVALLHAAELLRATGRPFPTFELLFTVSEETGLVGVKHLGGDVLRSHFAAMFDSSGPVGGITVKAPSQHGLRATFRGRAAHAGAEPERGRNAIHAAARAISSMSLGRIDEETTANIGVIRGGVASNIVPDLCEVKGECRSHDEGKLARVAASMVDALQEGAARTGVDVDVDLSHEYRAFALSGRSPVVRLGKAAISALGLEPRLLTSGGGSDANILNARGLPTINLNAGMMEVHSPDEYLPLEELERLCALVLHLIVLAPDYQPRKKPDRAQAHD